MSTSICTDVTEYNADVGTSTATTTSFQSLCCQQKTCSQLANLPNTKCSIDTKRKTSADNTRTSNFQQDCCEDKTCADFSSSKQCDSPSTVYNEERNTEITTDTTFQQECCKVGAAIVGMPTPSAEAFCQGLTVWGHDLSCTAVSSLLVTKQPTLRTT